jgi:hypothetical protein
MVAASGAPASGAPASDAPASGSHPAMELTVVVRDPSLKATSKPADAGLEEGIHWVDLRIVDEFVIELTLEVATDIVLASPPRLCLVGPFWNPLDAGLSDRCWGEPDLTELVGIRLPRDAAGNYVLAAGSPVGITATIERGDVRCDYPPGDWNIQVALIAAVDGEPGDRVYLPDVPIPIPIQETAPLQYLASRDTRFCSYKQAIFLQQGEPTIQASPGLLRTGSAPHLVLRHMGAGAA